MTWATLCQGILHQAAQKLRYMDVSQLKALRLAFRNDDISQDRAAYHTDVHRTTHYAFIVELVAA
jgi:predicted DNA-binding protein (UPF0251 family)